MKAFPFSEDGNIRVFSKNLTEEDLEWHWDEDHRVICALHETDWRLQFDNQLSEPLVLGEEVFIPAGTWHRLIKGTNDLRLKVLKHAVLV